MLSQANFAQSRCRFGIASQEITPPLGIYHRMWGAAKHDRATGVHCPLRATVLAFAPLIETSPIQDRQFLVAIDHCILGTKELDILLKAITAESPITEEQVVFVCSHTHAAGLLSLDRVDLPGGELIPEYLNSLAQTIAGLVQESLESRQAATIIYGVGHCNLAANRDYRDEQGRQYVCGYNPDEPADDSVLVARVDAEDDSILATIVNYACHPTTLAWDNTLISPDFPGTVREIVERATGAPCVFLQGASGELGPREGFVGDLAVAEKNGRQLGYAALSVLESLPFTKVTYQYRGAVVSGATIGTWAYRPMRNEELQKLSIWSSWRGAIDLPYRSDLMPLDEIPEELHKLESQEAEARSQGDEISSLKYRALAERRRREYARRSALPAGDTYPYQAALWRIGEAVWICVQGEPYSVLQTKLRGRFPDIPLIVASIGFSWGVAYLPPAEKYGLGLYQENIAVVAQGALETAIDALADRIEKLLQIPSHS